MWNNVVITYNKDNWFVTLLTHFSLLLFLRNMLKMCFRFVFTLQGPPGLPGPKVIKCMLCHPGPVVKRVLYLGSVKLHNCTYCLLRSLLAPSWCTRKNNNNNNVTLHSQVPTLPLQAPRAYFVPIHVRTITLNILFFLLFVFFGMMIFCCRLCPKLWISGLCRPSHLCVTVDWQFAC